MLLECICFQSYVIHKLKKLPDVLTYTLEKNVYFTFLYEHGNVKKEKNCFQLIFGRGKMSVRQSIE